MFPRPSPPLHRRYYALAAGHWVGTFTLTITHPWRLLTAPLPWTDKLSLAALALAERLLGPATLTTHVRPTEDPDRVAHEAILSRYGVVLHRGHRRFRLHPDGASLTIEGEEQSWPFLGPPRALPPGEGRTTDPQHTTYQLPMAGTTWQVTFAISPQNAWSQVTTPWAEASERLRRAR